MQSKRSPLPGITHEWLVERFWPRVDPSGECWLWTAGKCGGYGAVTVPGQPQWTQAHRIAYEVLVGVIPAGYIVHHECRTKACVNPGHLRAVTRAEHGVIHQSDRPARPIPTHCRKGHELTPDNSFLRNDRKERPACLTCRHDRTRRYRARRRLAAIQGQQ